MALALSVLGATCFFVSRWGINAPGLGGHDAGLALTLSFVAGLATYACAALAVLSALLLVVALVRGRGQLVHALALAAAAAPLVYLAFH